MIEIKLNNFPTHIKLSSRKYFKIGTQAVYNANLHYFQRLAVMKEMKKYIVKNLPINIRILESQTPIKMGLEFCVPRNFGDIRMVKGVIRWKPLKDRDYEASWDLDNRAWIWGKAIQDCLVEQEIIQSDTVDFIDSVEYKYTPINNLNDRSIIIRLYGKERISQEVEGRQVFLRA